MGIKQYSTKTAGTLWRLDIKIAGKTITRRGFKTQLEAKKEGRRPVDGEITTACATSCPSEALVFGDMKDPKSRISKMLQIKSMEKGVEAQEPRAYHVLEELREMPNVWYLTKIRNKDEKKEAANAHS